MSFSNLKKLIKDLTKTSKTKWAIKEEMADMYKQDALDTEVVLMSLLSGRYKWADEKLSMMDTLPRDNAVLAIVEDMGNDWAKANIGWSFK
jgi:hypothetical protein|tara:strand:+ start:499 stop:771 length:273 start_codon:yes stop_codon:yes gene_type:complete